MQSTNWESRHTHTNVEEPNTHNNNSPLITHEQLEGTPFHITGNEEKGYFLRLGDYRLTDFKKTIKEVENELINNDWNILLTVIAAVMHKSNIGNIELTK